MRALLIIAVVAVTSGCEQQTRGIDGLFSRGEWAVIESLSPLPDAPPPDPTNAFGDDPAAATLGQKLFFDTAPGGPIIEPDDGENGGLGAAGETGRVGCQSCHMPDDGWFQDRRSNPPATTLGVDWSGRNSPPAVNAAFYEWFKWAGGSDTMWVQAIGTTESSRTHGSSRLAVAHNIAAKYRAEYDAVFPEPLDAELGGPGRFPATGKPGDPGYDGLSETDKNHVTGVLVNYGKAIHAYERLLVSRNSPFDQYVAGDFEAIGNAAKRGLKLFIGKAGCVACHNTPLFSDNEFHNVAISQEGTFVTPVAEESGRYAAVEEYLAGPEFSGQSIWSDDTSTDRITDLVLSDSLRGQFRTKHLRQIAQTAPYMHTGQFETLLEVVEHYDDARLDGEFQGETDLVFRKLNLSSDEIDDIVAFLETLTGEEIPASLRQDTSLP